MTRRYRPSDTVYRPLARLRCAMIPGPSVLIVSRLVEIFFVFLRLGLTSFGGPVAHLGYFREELVARRRWLAEESYADLVALCQLLPGPASSQVCIGLGLGRGGLAGAVAAWAAFTAPSAALLMLFAAGVSRWSESPHTAWIHALKLVAVAVVAQAVWAMATRLCPDRPRATLALVVAALVLLMPGRTGQLLGMGLAATAGGLLLRPSRESGAQRDDLGVNLRRPVAVGALALFALGLAGLPLLARAVPSHALQIVDSFYRSGSLVFGGGHVVLPLLEAEVVLPGWIDQDRFLAGYGAAQAVPGPLFAFAAYLGAAMKESPSGLAGGLLALGAIYAPSFLLVVGTLPLYVRLRRSEWLRRTLTGVNAGVVGLLLAALYDPVFMAAVHGPADLAAVLTVFALLVWWRVPPWGVVLAAAAVGLFWPLVARGAAAW